MAVISSIWLFAVSEQPIKSQEVLLMKNTKKVWNPYLAGALSGVVLILSVWIAGKYFGASTTFVRSAGLIEKTFSA